MVFSLGAETALTAAPSLPELTAIVADSAFADAAQVLEVELPKASGLPAIFNPGVLAMARMMYGIDLANHKPVEAVARLGSRPLLLIHGALDSTVPLSQAYALQRAAANNPNMHSWVVSDAEHARAFKQHPEDSWPGCWPSSAATCPRYSRHRGKQQAAPTPMRGEYPTRRCHAPCTDSPA